MASKIFAYGRVSTKDQNEDRQMIDFLDYGIDERDIFIDKQSGRNFQRENYLTLRDKMLREGDILVVKSIDRFGRNYSEIRREWEYITKEIKADIIVLDFPILNTTQYKDLLGNVIADIVLAVLSFGAQLEVDTKSQAQQEGIAAAHRKGVKFGRPQISLERWEEWYPRWKAGEITAVECYSGLGISKSSFYRTVRIFEKEANSNLAREKEVCPKM